MKQIFLFGDDAASPSSQDPGSKQLDLFANVEGVRRLLQGGFAVDREPAATASNDPVEVYLASLLSEKSRRTMSAALNTVAAELQVPRAVEWGELRYGHAVALRSRLAESGSPATANKVLSAFRGVARAAMRLGLLEPAHYAQIADVEGVRGYRLPAGRHVEGPEIAAMLNACDRRLSAGVRDAALIAVLRVAGLRRAELVALDLADLDRQGWTLRVLGKGNRERVAYVAQAAPEIAGWLAVRGEREGPLFYSLAPLPGPPRRLGESSVAWVVGRVAARARVASVSPHDLRRTFVGDLLDLGADLAVVQKLAGHQQVTTTQRYDRRDDRVAARAAALLTLPRGR